MEAFLTLSFIAILIYLLNQYSLSYWKRRNVPQADPKFLLGNLNYMLDVSLSEAFQKLYEKYKHHKFVGIYFTYKPALLINDPEIVNLILVKEFSSFHDRPVQYVETDPITENLFFLKGQKWRDLRAKMTPTFTSGKLKMMFPIMKNCSNTLVEYVENNIITGNKDIFDIKDLYARFTINIISSIGFGIENDCINEPNNEFRKIAMKIMDKSLISRLKMSISFLTPQIMSSLNLQLKPKEVGEFFSSIVKQTIEYRERNNFHRNDFMDLMIQLKNNGYISVDKHNNNDAMQNQEIKTITENELIGQAFVFFGAGFETSSSLMTMCLFELCRNKEIMKRVQLEIDTIMEKFGEISYESLQEMKYLECCMDEAIRIHPVVPFHFRTVTKDFNFPGTDFILEKGTSVYIPVSGLQRDPEIYEDPMEFRPERFIDSPIGNGISGAYTPFGDGQRICIGARLGKLQAKLGLVSILQKFNCKLYDQQLLTKYPSLEKFEFVVSLTDSLNIKMSLRA